MRRVCEGGFHPPHMFYIQDNTRTYNDAEKSPTVLSARDRLSTRSLGLPHLCGDADNKPVQGCHDHRRAANDHEERDEDRVLERELDD